MYRQSFPQGIPKVLAVKLSATGERSVRLKHPWIFTDSIEKINKTQISKASKQLSRTLSRLGLKPKPTSFHQCADSQSENPITTFRRYSRTTYIITTKKL